MKRLRPLREKRPVRPFRVAVKPQAAAPRHPRGRQPKELDDLRRNGKLQLSPGRTPARADSPPPPSDETADSALSVTPSNGPTAAELAATLAAVQREKADLETIVQGLQEDLAAQQSRLFELTDSLDQAQADLKAKTDSLQETEEALAEAKATILLSAPAPAPAATAPIRPALPRRSGGDIIPRQPSPGPAQPGYVRGVPTYTPQSDQPNPMLSDADIGWVD